MLAGCGAPAGAGPGEAAGPVFSPDSSVVRVAAGPQYARRGWWWQRLVGPPLPGAVGRPVSAPTLRLGAAGLHPTRTGGSFQTNSLHLRARDGRSFVLRSVDKDLSQSLNENWLERARAPSAARPNLRRPALRGLRGGPAGPRRRGVSHRPAAGVPAARFGPRGVARAVPVRRVRCLGRAPRPRGK
ncbi:MAG: hypothetical protein WKG07_17515 [Hymenobacter sp.]